MQISSQTVLRVYQSLRTAATARQESAEVGMSPELVNIVSSQIDDNPTTTDSLVASAWDGCFSHSAATLTFTERQQDGKQVLEFAADQPKEQFSAEMDSSRAVIDMKSGDLLSSSGNGNFLIFSEPPKISNTQVKPDGVSAALRKSYSDIKEAAGRGEREVWLGMGQVTITDSKPGILVCESWDGSMSSGTCLETYREYQKDGVSMVEHTKITPADPFMVGSQAQTVVNNFSL